MSSVSHDLIQPTALDVPTSEAVVSQWLDFHGGLLEDPITEKGRESYEYFWRTWLNFLVAARVGEAADAYRWTQAEPHHVVAFLANGPQSRKSGRNVSEITRRRYWRLLDRIYTFAVKRLWIKSNPVKGLARTETPKVEDPLAAYMTPFLWDQSLLIIRAMDVADPVSCRNRALLLSLFELGLIPQEARNIRLRDVCHVGSRITALQLDGPGVNQRRRMSVSDELADALSEWRDSRRSVPVANHTDIFFCSTQATGPMGGDSLFLLVKKVLMEASVQLNVDPPIRMGPQIVRNTRLIRWLNEGRPPAEVAVWAGLKDVKSFRHLRQAVNPEISAHLTKVGGKTGPTIQLQADLFSGAGA